MASPLGQTYTINGIKVYFPWKPYPSQFSMMDKIIKGLERGENCLLESPTGSGKSLALLCSALAWQRRERDRIVAENDDVKGEDCCCKCNTVEISESVPAEIPVPPVIPQQQHNVTNVGTSVSDPLVIEDDPDDDDDDFKTTRTKFRTPGGTSVRGHVSIQYESDSTVTAPEWQMETGQAANANPCSCSCNAATNNKRSVPKIYFGTRTHKQIAQICRELGRTAYSDTRMCILSSRENTCIDPEVSNSRNKNEECKLKLDNTGCRFKDRVTGRITHQNLRLNGLGQAWDLEDFVGHCKKKGVSACPYYGSRELMDGADIIFCPYNYLIDPLIRKSMSLQIKDQIIIVDEAHNIEDSSRDAGSNTCTQQQMKDGRDDLAKLIYHKVKVAEHSLLDRMLEKLLELVMSAEHSFENDYDSKVWSGTDMAVRLQQAGLGPQNADAITKALSSLTEDESEGGRGGQKEDHKMKSATTSVIAGVLMVLGFMYIDDSKHLPDYRMAVTRTMSFVDQPTDDNWLGKRRRGANRRPSFMYSLHFWCLNPAVCFAYLGAEVRSVILTSGTLSPMDSFQSELGVPFPIQLEANHVIGKSQVWVGAISRGPRGGPLLGTYQVSETFSYQDEVGELLLGVCQTIPHGVLCFFPSYKYLDKMNQRWKSTGTWEEMEKSKTMMVEPRRGDKKDFDELLKNFYTIIEDTEVPDEGGVTGVCLLAVCRGKVSEGMDFTDNNARAVLTVGIPFPNFKDTQVELKKNYNNTYAASRGLLRGNDWYEIQAYRALNQALGRCIRHRNDWGALILVDERFGKNPQRYTKGLSKWVRQRINFFQRFEDAQRSLIRYTQERLTNPATDSILQTQSPSPATFRQPINLPALNATIEASASPQLQRKSENINKALVETAPIHINLQDVDPQKDMVPLGAIFQAHRLAKNPMVNGDGGSPLIAQQVTGGAGIRGGFIPSQLTSHQVGMTQGKAGTVGSGGGFIPSQFTPASHTQVKADVTLHAGSLGPTQPDIGKGEDIVDFNPPLASTQMTQNAVTGKGKTPRGHLEFTQGSSDQNTQKTTPSLKEKLLRFKRKPVLNQTLQNLCDLDETNSSPSLLKSVKVTSKETTSSKVQQSVFQFVNVSKTPVSKENYQPSAILASRSSSPLLFDSDGETAIDAVINQIAGKEKSNKIQLDSKISTVQESPVKASSPPMDLGEESVKLPLFSKTSFKVEEEISTQNLPKKNRLSFSRRKSEDKLETMNVYVKEEVKEEVDDAGAVSGELNIRRSNRKRKRTKKMEQNMKRSKVVKGVDFLDELEHTEEPKKDQPSTVMCAQCNQTLTKSAVLLSPATVPAGLIACFSKQGKVNENDMRVVDGPLLLDGATRVKMEKNKEGPCLNSHYSATDHAVYEVLCCNGHHHGTDKYIGLKVQMTGAQAHSSLAVGQVWLLPDTTVIT